MFGQFMRMNNASASGSGTLPSNTITNPKEDSKGITTRSGNAYQGPTVPTTSSPIKVVERKTEVTKDTVPPTNNRSIKDVQPPVVRIETSIPNSKPVVAPVVEPLKLPLLADALILMPKFGSTIKSLLTNKEKLFELARTPLNENCSAVLLKKLPEKLGDPDKFLTPCDFPGMDECLALSDLVASINIMPLFDLPPHLEYAFLEGDDKLPVIISKDLKDEEKTALIKVLKLHKQALAWQRSNIKGIDPEFYTHKILIEDDFKPAVQHQRRVNPKIHKVIKKEVLKLLDARLIYPISDRPWVSLVHCVPKKGGFTVAENEENELIPTL
nr:reverse transcriptase domain-containing protein [Tanacetum cinerariifolium]